MMSALLLEKVHGVAKKNFENEGISVQEHGSSDFGANLRKNLKGHQILGLRSKSVLSAHEIESCSELLGIGAFCIGTNQIHLEAATQYGIAVFNAPFSNTRSVAEMVLSEIIALSRRLFMRAFKMHLGQWDKSSQGSYEVRGKTLGIVGYGHIGSQVGILAEALGLSVKFYDVQKKLPLGNAIQVDNLKKLLSVSDFISLHVPLTDQTQNMFKKEELEAMKPGAYLINASRGAVVVLEDLKKCLDSGHLAGAAIDVFPEEPKSNQSEFTSILQKCENVILTPHVGGSTQEAQENIGQEVSEALIRFVKTGHSVGSVNFPHLYLKPLRAGQYRILNVHKNIPGVLGATNKIISELGVNIVGQQLSTNDSIGYLAMDLETKPREDLLSRIQSLNTSIKTRVVV